MGKDALGTKKDFIKAVEEGNIDLIKRFIKAGIDINKIRDDQGRTILELAVIKRQKATVIELLKAGANFNVTSENGENILDSIITTYGLTIYHDNRLSEEECKEYDYGMVELLLSVGVNINEDCYNTAIYCGSLNLMVLLNNARIIDRIFGKENLERDDIEFLKQYELNRESIALRFISLFTMQSESNVFLAMESFNLITKGTILFGLIDSYVEAHLSRIESSSFITVIPSAFGLKKYTKSYLAELCKDNDIEFSSLVENRSLLEGIDEAFKSDEVFDNFIRLHALYLKRNYVSVFINQMLDVDYSFPTDLFDLEQASPSKPSKAIKSLLKADICLSKTERENLFELSHDLLEAQFEPVLEPLGLHAVDVDKDGNCFFHVLSRILGVNHSNLRHIATNYMLEHPEQFQDFTPEGLDEYIAEISQEGEWADNLVIQALLNIYEMELNIYMLNGEVIHLTPRDGIVVRVGNAAYTGTHYLAVEDNIIIREPVVEVNGTHAAVEVAADYASSLVSLRAPFIGELHQDDSDSL